MAGDFAALERKLDALGRELSGAAKTKRLHELGRAAKQDVAEAVRADLGDLSFSRWRPGRPIQMTARYDLESDGLAVVPTPRSRGPFRVLEQGRRGGKHGTTAGRQSWSDAERLMQQRMPKRVFEQVGDAMRKVF
jgi:hypothetical protein